MLLALALSVIIDGLMPLNLPDLVGRKPAIREPAVGAGEDAGGGAYRYSMLAPGVETGVVASTAAGTTRAAGGTTSPGRSEPAARWWGSLVEPELTRNGEAHLVERARVEERASLYGGPLATEAMNYPNDAGFYPCPLYQPTERSKEAMYGVVDGDYPGASMGDSRGRSGGDRDGVSADLRESSGSVREVTHGDDRLALDGDAGVVRRLGIRERPQAVIGTATYYHPSLAGGLMRDGVTRYEPSMSGVAAATSWPLGTVLEVCGPTRRCIQVVISDTGILGPGHVDLTEASFIALAGSLAPGRISITVKELK